MIFHFPAQRLLSFYQWSKELLTRLNIEFWNSIKTVLGQVIREKLGTPDRDGHGGVCINKNILFR